MSRETLEKLRGHISHDLLKNGFLERIGTAQGTLRENAEKSKLAFIAWCHVRGEDVSQGRSAKASIDEALSAWPETRESLRDFFLHAPARCGLIVTKQFTTVRKSCLDGDSAWIPSIDAFVADFWDLAYKSQYEQWQRLESFWAAADSLYGALSDMRLGYRGSRPSFFDFFQYPENCDTPDHDDI